MSDPPRIAPIVLPPPIPITGPPPPPPPPPSHGLPPPIQPSVSLSAEGVLATALLRPGSIYSTPSSAWYPLSRLACSARTRNACFSGIHTSTLQAVSKNQLDRFKTVVRSLSIRFPATIIPRFRGWSVTTKADVVHFLDSQVLDVAWQVVLEIVSSERGCNLTAMKKLPIQSCIPDQLFGLEIACADGTKRFQPCAVAEIKAPGNVTRLASVLENALINGTDLTEDWIELGSQLRKWAVQTQCRDILVMDERTAIYFQFSEDSSDVEEDIECLVGSESHSMTMRQLVAFACWRGLKRELKLANSSAQSLARSATLLSCAFVDNATRVKRSPEATGESETKRPRHGITGDGSTVPFGGWVAGYEFQMAQAPFVLYRNAESTNCGSPASSSSLGDTPPKRAFAPPEGTAWRVARVIWRKVAVLECAGRQYIGKWFDVRSDYGETEHSGEREEAETYLHNEVTVYGRCHALQGREIPHGYGVGNIAGISGKVLVVEYLSGPTVTDVLQKFRKGEMDLTAEHNGAKWLATVRDSAIKAVQALHRFNVGRVDLCGQNMVVLNDSVVIVDFDVSVVAPVGKELREWEQWEQWEEWVRLGVRLGAAFVI